MRLKSRYPSSNGLCGKCAKRSSAKSASGECQVCHNVLFESIPRFLALAKSESSKLEFSSFSVSSKIPREFELSEEKLWGKKGVSAALSLKTQINDGLARALEKGLSKKFSSSSPDAVFLFDFEENNVLVSPSPLYIYGHYRKLSRELSQTRWPCDCKQGCEKCGGTLLKHVSVEDLATGPMLAAFGAKNAKFHGAGREDVDARMLGDGRPFVIELESPAKRSANLAKLEEKINSECKGKIELFRLSLASQGRIESLKMARLEKSYRALVQTTGPVAKSQLSKIPLSAELSQKTPVRVLHRRSDLERMRQVKKIKWKQISPRSIEFILTTESGTYVKEFISGDGGRTRPSISEFLGVPATCAELDVISIKHSFVSDYW